MKKILLLLLVFSTVSVTYADDWILQIWQNDGNVMNINLNDEPVTTYSEGNLLIRTKNSSITYPLEKVKKYTFVSSSDIQEINGMGASFSQDGETLIFRNLKENTNIEIFTVSGQVVKKINNGKHSKATVSVSNLPIGVYVIKANDLTFKITKR
jgi:hypothetical protein